MYLCVLDCIRVVVLHPVILCVAVKSLDCMRCVLGVYCTCCLCICCVFLCVPVSVKYVCVSPARSSSPSGAPGSLPPVSSLGCDRSQLTPLLLWQPKNSLEKGQLATSLGLPRSRDSGVVRCGSALCWPCGPQMASVMGFLFPFQVTPKRLPASLIKGPRRGMPI